MLTHYERLLRSVVSDQNQPVGALEMITAEERQQLLFGFNDTAADYPKDKTIVDLFYRQAANTPDNIAVVFGGQRNSPTASSMNARTSSDIFSVQGCQGGKPGGHLRGAIPGNDHRHSRYIKSRRRLCANRPGLSPGTASLT